MYALRANISFAIVCMVEKETIPLKEHAPIEKCVSNSSIVLYFKNNGGYLPEVIVISIII